MPSGLIQSEQLLAKRAAVGRDLAFSYLGFFDVFLAIGCWWCSSIMFKRNRSHVCSFKRLYESKDLQIGARRHVHIGTLTVSVLSWPKIPKKDSISAPWHILANDKYSKSTVSLWAPWQRS